MDRTVKLSRVNGPLGELSYPISREEATSQLSDVTVLLADGEENLGEIVAGSQDDRFESLDDLENEVYNLMPREALGEPGQSEGEG